MSINIAGLYEAFGLEYQPIQNRYVQCKKYPLGYDNLVVLNKKESGFFSSKMASNFYHYISGLDLSTEAHFSAYFVQLLNRQEAYSWSPGVAKFQILKGTCFVWNSFKECDVTLSTKVNGGFQAHGIGEKGSLFALQKEDFYQIHLSSCLRYFRSGEHLNHVLFGFPFVDVPLMSIVSGVSLQMEDFRYILENHPMKMDIGIPIANALIISLSRDSITDILNQYHLVCPVLISGFVATIHPTSGFGLFIMPILESFFMKYPDDIPTAYYLLQQYLHIGLIEKCQTVLPLLYNNVFMNPLSGIGCALYCIYVSKYSEAISFLNATAYAKGWDTFFSSSHSCVTTTPTFVPPLNPNQAEKHLYTSPLNGPSFEYFHALTVICSSVGSEHFGKLCKEFIGSKKVGPSAKVISAKIPQIQYNKFNVTEDDFLYDPGLESFCVVSEELCALPISHTFKEAVSSISKAFKERTNLLSGIKSSFDITQELILSIRLRDSNLFEELCAILFRNETPTSFQKLLMFRGISLGLTSQYERILPIKPVAYTLTEKNSLEFATVFFEKLIKINSECTRFITQQKA